MNPQHECDYPYPAKMSNIQVTIIKLNQDLQWIFGEHCIKPGGLTLAIVSPKSGPSLLFCLILCLTLPPYSITHALHSIMLDHSAPKRPPVSSCIIHILTLLFSTECPPGSTPGIKASPPFKAYIRTRPLWQICLVTFFRIPFSFTYFPRLICILALDTLYYLLDFFCLFITFWIY